MMSGLGTKSKGTSVGSLSCATPSHLSFLQHAQAVIEPFAAAAASTVGYDVTGVSASTLGNTQAPADKAVLF